MPSTVGFEEVLSQEMAESVYRLYVSDFGDLNNDSPCDQMWPRDLFMKGMTDPSVVKAVLYDDDTKEWLAIAIYTNNWEYFPWMAQRFYRERYPEDWEGQKLFYTVCTLAASKRMGHMSKIMFAMANHVVTQERGRMAYDLCDRLRVDFDWPTVIEGVAEQVEPMQTEVVGTQTYYVIGPKKP